MSRVINTWNFTQPKEEKKKENIFSINRTLTDLQTADPLSAYRGLYQGSLNNLVSSTDRLISQGPNLYGFDTYQKGAEDELRSGYHTYFEDALKRLTESPGSLEELGSYKFALSQGQNAINRKAAAMGTALGSGTAKDLAAHASGLASSTYFDMYKGLQGSLGTAYQGLGTKLQGWQGLAGGALNAYQGQVGAYQNQMGIMKGLVEGNALQAAALRSQEINNLNQYDYRKWETKKQIQAAQEAKKSSGSSGWGSALGSIAGAAASIFLK
jgi:hypothetical protein